MLAQNYEPHFSGAAIFGFNATQVDGDDMAGYNKLGLNTGFMADYPLNDHFSMSMEILYSQRGTACHNGPNQVCLNGSSKLRMNYAEIPLLLNYHDKTGVSFGAGFSVARLVKTTYFYQGVLQNSYPAAPYKNFDYELMANGTYMFAPHLGVNVRYSYSFIPFAVSPTSNFVNKGMFNNVVSARLQFMF